MAELTLKWEKFGLSRGLYNMLQGGELVDVTLACQGEFLQAHKSVLAASSQQFRQIFLMNPCQHPVVFMQDVQLSHLQALLNFIYTGEATVNQRELPGFMHTAEVFQITGLSSNNESFVSSQDWEYTDAESSNCKKSRLSEPNSGSSNFEENTHIASPPLPAEMASNSNNSSETSASHHNTTVHSNESLHARPETSNNISSNPMKVELPNINLQALADRQLTIKPSPELSPRPGSSKDFCLEADTNAANKVLLPRRPCALLDGKFFKVVKDSRDGLWAQCQICLPHYKLIKGSWETTSNFKTHLTRVHRQHLSAYDLYKKTWRHGDKFRFLQSQSQRHSSAPV